MGDVGTLYAGPLACLGLGLYGLCCDLRQPRPSSTIARAAVVDLSGNLVAPDRNCGLGLGFRKRILQSLSIGRDRRISTAGKECWPARVN